MTHTKESTVYFWSKSQSMVQTKPRRSGVAHTVWTISSVEIELRSSFSGKTYEVSETLKKRHFNIILAYLQHLCHKMFVDRSTINCKFNKNKISLIYLWLRLKFIMFIDRWFTIDIKFVTGALIAFEIQVSDANGPARDNIELRSARSGTIDVLTYLSLRGDCRSEWEMR